MMENIVMASRSRKLRDRSQMMHLQRDNCDKRDMENILWHCWAELILVLNLNGSFLAPTRVTIFVSIPDLSRALKLIFLTQILKLLQSVSSVRLFDPTLTGLWESHLSLTARSNMRMTAIQIKAVRNRSSRMVVRGNTRACKYWH